MLNYKYPFANCDFIIEEEEKQYLVVYGVYANGYIAETLEKELSASNEKEAEKEAQQIAERLEKENSREDYEITLLIEELRQIDE